MPNATSAIPRYAPATPSTLTTRMLILQNSRSPSPAPISELVCETSAQVSPPPFANIHTSKHNPDFRVRNQEKILAAENILSSLQIHLQSAHRAQDQSKFDEIYARVLQVGRSLGDLPQCPQIPDIEARLDVREEGLGEIMSVNRAGDWYGVMHAVPRKEGEAHEVCSSRRIREARDAYEASLVVAELEVSGVKDGSSEDAGVSDPKDGLQSISQDSTLVEGDCEELSLDGQSERIGNQRPR